MSETVPTSATEVEVDANKQALEMLDDSAAAAGVLQGGAVDINKLGQHLTEQAKAAEQEEEAVGGLKPLPGMEKLAKQLQEALDDGDVDLRKGLGQRFTAALKADEEMREQYASIKGVASATKMKKDFRVRWAKKELELKTVIVKTKEEALVEQYGEKGVYMSLDKFIMEEGGPDNPMAVARATNYALECVRRGPPWLEWNSMKKVTEILRMDKIRNTMLDKRSGTKRVDTLVSNTAVETQDGGNHIGVGIKRVGN